MEGRDLFIRTVVMVEAVTYQCIRYSIKSVNRAKIPPMSIGTIKTSRPEFFEFVKKRNVIN